MQKESVSTQPGESAEALPAALGDLLGGVDGVGDKSTLDALPAVLDLDVPAAHQVKDVPRQIHEGLKCQMTRNQMRNQIKMSHRYGKN